MGRSTLFTTSLRRPATGLATVALALALGLLGSAAVAGAQTATVPTTAVATPATTVAGSGTTLPVPTTVSPSATTTTTEAEPILVPPGSTESSSTPWLAIALIAVGVLILVVLVVTALLRRGGGRSDDGSARRGSTRGPARGGRGGAARAEWREAAAKATAEAGACVRQVATGGEVTGAVVSQLVTSIRGYGTMAGSAPDDGYRQLVERARRALQGLGQEIDADHQLRRAQPPVDPARLAASARTVSEAAGETDRVLRAVYRELNEPE